MLSSVRTQFDTPKISMPTSKSISGQRAMIAREKSPSVDRSAAACRIEATDL
jgi:hypothetical protein